MRISRNDYYLYAQIYKVNESMNYNKKIEYG